MKHNTEAATRVLKHDEHIASALELGNDLDGLVIYADRMADAARAQGISVLAPD